MKDIIISDTHEKIWYIPEVLKKEEPYDSVTLLGDYWDSFISNEETTEATVKWILSVLDNPKFTLLLGNHDLSYAYPMTLNFQCSGYSNDKSKYINSIFKRKDWNKFKLYHKVQGFYCSHAGMGSTFVHPIEGFSDKYLDTLCKKALDMALGGMVSPILEAGRGRGGWALEPGLTWCDFNCESKPIAGIHQIIGHTPINDVKKSIIYTPNKKRATGSIRDIDFHGRKYAIIIDGKVILKDTGDPGYNDDSFSRCTSDSLWNTY